MRETLNEDGGLVIIVNKPIGSHPLKFWKVSRTHMHSLKKTSYLIIVTYLALLMSERYCLDEIIKIYFSLHIKMLNIRTRKGKQSD